MKIANKISLSFFITASILTIPTAYIFYITSKSNLEEAISSHLMTTTQSRTAHIDTLLDEYKQIVKLMSAETTFIELLNTSKDNPEYNQRLEMVNKRVNTAIKFHEGFNIAQIINKYGIIVASTEKEHLGRDKSKDKIFLKGKEGIYIDDIHFACENKSSVPFIGVAAPIFKDDNFLGVITLRVKTTKLFGVLEDRTGLGKTGEIYLVNKDGFMISPSRFKEDVILKQKVDTANVRNCLIYKDKEYTLEEKVVTVFSDYRGINVLGAGEYISQMQWCLLAEIEEKEVLAPLAKIKFLCIIVMFFIPIIAWLIGIFVSKIVTAPIRKLHRETEMIGAGNLDYKVETDAKDEIGQLSRAFNKMAEDLKKTTTSVDNLNKEITIRKKVETKLKQTSKELARSNADLEQFAYVASHDLQEPLRMVKSYVQLLAKRYQKQLDTDADDFIAYAVDGATRMQGLIDGLLTYSRVSARGKKFEPCNCTTFLDQALANLKILIEKSGAVITYDALPIIMADAPQLVQLFQNLIANAIKFHSQEPPHIHISARQKESKWVFLVRDNGIGIPSESFQRIFMIFQRLHGRGEYPGAGIGLAICKGIVERHGGEIWVESKPGKGSTFYFTIQLGEVKNNE